MAREKTAKKTKPKSVETKSKKTVSKTKKMKRAKKPRKVETKNKSKKSAQTIRADKVEAESPKSKSRKTKLAEAAAAFNPYASLDSSLDAIDRDIGVASSLSMDDDRCSTGSLMLDLVTGNGLTAGWYTSFGPEQSCKSTTAMMFLISAVVSKVPILSYWDYEGSGSRNYIRHMLKTYGLDLTVDQIFGVKNPKTSEWEIRPIVRYKKPQIAERFFDYVFKLEKMLPDKVQLGEEWFYVYDDTKENRKIVGDIYDKNYWRKSKKLRVPAPDGTLQAVIICDSYPAMLSERLDDEDAGEGMAEQARMFSKQIRRIKGRLASKRIAIIGVNQLRQAPGVRYGDPTYEPCGDALKFYSDCRLRFTPRALSGVPYVKGKGKILEEKSVTVKGAVDQYRFIHVRGTKNKLGMPYMEGWMRLWIKDGNEEPRGFDPVWDTFIYLDGTGQIEHKSRTKILLKIGKHTTKKPMTWDQFKLLILGNKKQRREIFDAVGLDSKPFDLRAVCLKQIQSNAAMGLFAEHKKAGGVRNDDDDDDAGGSSNSEPDDD